jgi:hypothetical protein
MPYSDLLTSHQRKCEYAWPTWKMEMLVIWKHVMKSLLMGNVYNRYRV